MLTPKECPKSALVTLPTNMIVEIQSPHGWYVCLMSDTTPIIENIQAYRVHYATAMMSSINMQP